MTERIEGFAAELFVLAVFLLGLALQAMGVDVDGTEEA